MKISISQKELNKALNIVQKVVSTKTSMPILSGILLEALDGRLNVTATDLELGINTFVECDIEEEGAVVVQSKLLGDFIRKLPSNSLVNLFVNDNNNTEIKCLNSGFNILGNSAAEFPNDTFENEGVEFKISSSILNSLIKYTSFATSQDNLKPIFTGCLMEIKDGMCIFVALDGFRMAVKSENLLLETEVSTIIPAKALSEIIRITEGEECDINITLSETHISFRIGNTTIISGLLEGKFVDYKSLLKNEFITTVSVNIQDMKNGVERVSLLAREDKNNLMIFDIKENTMQICSASDFGNAEEFMVLKEKTGEDIKIGFNSKYILEVLRVLDSEEVKLKFVGNINPCFIEEANNEEFVYMVLPVRIS